MTVTNHCPSVLWQWHSWLGHHPKMTYNVWSGTLLHVYLRWLLNVSWLMLIVAVEWNVLLVVCVACTLRRSEEMISLMHSWHLKASAALPRSGSAKIMSTLFVKIFVISTIHSLVWTLICILLVMWLLLYSPLIFFCFVLFKFLWHLPGSFFILLKSLWHLYTVSEQPQLSSWHSGLPRISSGICQWIVSDIACSQTASAEEIASPYRWEYSSHWIWIAQY